MQAGALTSQFDVGLLAILTFFLFFLILVAYLRRQDRLEGYPLLNDKTGNPRYKSFAFPPAKKTFILNHGGSVTLPRDNEAPPIVAADESGLFRGSAIEPTGDPMLDGLGPAAYAQRADEAEAGFDDGKPRIMPLRLLPDFFLESADPDPRGWPVIAGDNVQAGVVRDVWVDRSEVCVRYIEVDVTAGGGGRRVVVPMPLVKLNRGKRVVVVRCVFAHHFAKAPLTKSLEQITLLEEDRISAYFASGQLYASPERFGPLI